MLPEKESKVEENRFRGKKEEEEKRYWEKEAQPGANFKMAHPAKKLQRFEEKLRGGGIEESTKRGGGETQDKKKKRSPSLLLLGVEEGDRGS